MNYSQMMNSAYRFITSSGGTELLGDNDFINFMNMSQGMIVAMYDWPFLKDELDITPTSPATTFTLPRELYKEYEVKGITSSGGEVYLSPASDQLDSNEYNIFASTIKTKEEYATLRIHGSWGLTEIENNDSSLNSAIPLPHILQGALYHLLIAHALPVYIDTGHNTARFHYDVANIMIEMAAKKYGGQKGTKFVRPSQ